MRNPHKRTRPAYCMGCGQMFRLMHQMRDHRHTFRCGGTWRLMEIALADAGVLVEYQITTPDSYRPYRQSMRKYPKKPFPKYQFSEEHNRWLWL